MSTWKHLARLKSLHERSYLLTKPAYNASIAIPSSTHVLQPNAVRQLHTEKKPARSKRFHVHKSNVLRLKPVLFVPGSVRTDTTSLYPFAISMPHHQRRILATFPKSNINVFSQNDVEKSCFGNRTRYNPALIASLLSNALEFQSSNPIQQCELFEGKQDQKIKLGRMKTPQVNQLKQDNKERHSALSRTDKYVRKELYQSQLKFGNTWAKQILLLGQKSIQHDAILISTLMHDVSQFYIANSAKQYIWIPIITLIRALRSSASSTLSELHHARNSTSKKQEILKKHDKYCMLLSHIISTIEMCYNRDLHPPNSLLLEILTLSGRLGSIEQVEHCMKLRKSDASTKERLNMLRMTIRALSSTVSFRRTLQKLDVSPLPIGNLASNICTNNVTRNLATLAQQEILPFATSPFANQVLSVLQYDLIPYLPKLYDNLDDAQDIIIFLFNNFRNEGGKHGNHMDICSSNSTNLNKKSLQRLGSFQTFKTSHVLRRNGDNTHSPSSPLPKRTNVIELADFWARTPTNAGLESSLRALESELNNLSSLELNHSPVPNESSGSSLKGQPSSNVILPKLHNQSWNVNNLDNSIIFETLMSSELPNIGINIIPNENQVAHSIRGFPLKGRACNDHNNLIHPELAAPFLSSIIRFQDNSIMSVLREATKVRKGTSSSNNPLIYIVSQCLDSVSHVISELEGRHLSGSTISNSQKRFSISCFDRLARFMAQKGESECSLSLITRLSQLPTLLPYSAQISVNSQEKIRSSLLPNVCLKTIRSLISISGGKRDSELLWGLVLAELGRQGFNPYSKKFTDAWFNEHVNESTRETQQSYLSTVTLPLSLIVPFAIKYALKECNVFSAQKGYIDTDCDWMLPNLSYGLFKSLVFACKQNPQILLASLLNILESVEKLHATKLACIEAGRKVNSSDPVEMQDENKQERLSEQSRSMEITRGMSNCSVGLPPFLRWATCAHLVTAIMAKQDLSHALAFLKVRHDKLKSELKNNNISSGTNMDSIRGAHVNIGKGYLSSEGAIKPIVAILESIPYGRVTREMHTILDGLIDNLDLPIWLSEQEENGNTELSSSLSTIVDPLSRILLTNVLERRQRYQYANPINDDDNVATLENEMQIQRIKEESKFAATEFLNTISHLKKDPLYLLTKTSSITDK